MSHRFASAQALPPQGNAGSYPGATLDQRSGPEPQPQGGPSCRHRGTMAAQSAAEHRDVAPGLAAPLPSCRCRPPVLSTKQADRPNADPQKRLSTDAGGSQRAFQVDRARLVPVGLSQFQPAHVRSYAPVLPERGAVNAIKEVRKYILQHPTTASAQILARLTAAVAEETAFPLSDLYKLDRDAFDLAIELLQDWRLDRYYASRIKLFDVVLGEIPDA